jgi:hypothetical protein
MRDDENDVYSGMYVNWSQSRKRLRNVRFGSLAVIATDSSAMTALGWKADTQPGRMSALTDTGRSEALRRPESNGSYRPKAALFIQCRI